MTPEGFTQCGRLKQQGANKYLSGIWTVSGSLMIESPAVTVSALERAIRLGECIIYAVSPGVEGAMSALQLQIV